MKRIIAIAILAILLLSCGNQKMTMTYVDFKVYDPVYIAVEKGFFQKNGLEVKLLGSSLGGPTAIQAVASGRAHAGLSSIPAIINANAAGLPVIGIADIQSAIKNQSLEEYFVSDRIKNPSDLIGARFAVNLWKSSFHYTALIYLEKNGIRPEQINFILMPFDKQGAALEGGSVDIIGLMEPHSSAFKAISNKKVLFNAIDVFGEKQFSLIFVNRIWAENNPEETRAFCLGIKDAINWSIDNKDEAREIIAKYTGVKKENIPVYLFQKDGLVIKKDIDYWIEYMTKSGDLKTPWIKSEEIGTNRYQE